MATKKTSKMGRPANKYIAVTVYISFPPDAKLKDMMSDGNEVANSVMDDFANVSKVTVKKSEGPYPKRKPAAKKAAAKPAQKKPVKKPSRRRSA